MNTTPTDSAAHADTAKPAIHTPGEWTIYEHDGPEFYCEIIAGNDSEAVRICDIPSWPCAREEAEANARLIAAAPELLAALRALADNFEDNEKEAAEEQGYAFSPENCESLTNARAAIAKATASES